MSAPDKTPLPLLSVRDLRVAYGGIQAVKGVSFDVMPGELVCLIGSNGAGKTTTMKAVTRLLPCSGEVLYQGQSLTDQGPWNLVGQGLAMVPEGRGVFARMTVLENLQMGAYQRDDSQAIAADIERMYGLFPRLKERRSQLAGTLSGGEQQMLAMGRALMSRPRMLLLDEPSMGLSPLMVDRIFEVIEQVAAEGVTLLLVEQNLQVARALGDQVAVMDDGRVVHAGGLQALMHDEVLQQRLLGLAL